MSQLSRELVLKRVDEMLSWEEGWDGEGEPAISKDVATLALRLIDAVHVTCHWLPEYLVPAGNAGITVRWLFDEVIMEVDVVDDESGVGIGNVCVTYQRREYPILGHLALNDLACYISAGKDYRHDIHFRY